MTQILQLGLAAEQILINAEPTQSQIIGGAVNRPTVGVTGLTNRLAGLDLIIAVADIKTPLPPILGNYSIRSITINSRKYTTAAEWTQAWSAQYRINQPMQSQLLLREGTKISKLARHQVQLKEILVPGTRQTLVQAGGLSPSPFPVIVSVPSEVPTQPLLNTVAGTELDLAVIDVTITPGGQLSTVYADSTQNLQEFPVPPLATFATSAGTAATADSATSAGSATTAGTAGVATNIAGGSSSTGLGSIPYQIALNTTQLLLPNTTTQRRFLMQQGSGTIGAIPQWAAITSADLGVFVGDVKGSVVADDSTLMVDGVSGRIVGVIDSPTATLGTATVTSSLAVTGTLTTSMGSQTHYYRLAASITGISTAQDFYGATDAAVLDANSYYEIEYYVSFSKQTTNNALVFTTVNTQAPQEYTAVVDSFYIGGGNVTILATAMGVGRSTATTNTVTTTGVMSFSPEQSGHIRMRVFLRTNATTGGNIRLQVSTATGTCTALANSYYKVFKHPTANSGSFVV